MYKVKIINKKARPGFGSVVEHISFDSREDAVAYATPYWESRDEYHAILEDYSQVV
jgi:hypothetical protein